MSNVIQSIVRALDILEFCSKHKGAGVSDIARGLDLNKSTAFGIIKTLEYKGYLFKNDQTDNYHISLKIHSLANTAIESISIVDIVRPYLDELAAEYEETVHLVESMEMEVIYIDKRETNKPIRINTQIGNRLPMYCTGVGKAILSTMAEEEIDRYCESISFEPFTKNTINNAEKLKKELKKIRKIGYSLDDEEYQEDLFCVAVPIVNNSGNATNAISISIPKYRKSQSFEKEASQSLMAIAEKIEKNF